MAAGLEYFKTNGKVGWRIRNAAGVIEVTHAATFSTQADAAADAAADVRVGMAGLGIKEAAVTPPSAKSLAAQVSGTVVYVTWVGGWTPVELGRVGPPVLVDGGWNTRQAGIPAAWLAQGYAPLAGAPAGATWTVYGLEGDGTRHEATVVIAAPPPPPPPVSADLYVDLGSDTGGDYA